jgi:probable rRNA maturation factor
MVGSNIIINFDIVNKDWSKLEAYGLAYEVIKNILSICEKDDSEITIRFTDDIEMMALNKKWRKKNSLTNVLAFPNNTKLDLYEQSKHIGDIVLCYNVVKQEAKQRNISFSDHMIHLVVHGVLHLCGYDHIRKSDEENMIKHEKLILNGVGIKDPYINYN